MKKIWFVQIGGKSEGPFSFDDLKQDRRLTPDTLVWKNGFTQWKPIREVAELKKLFQDETEPPASLNPTPTKPTFPEDELALDYQRDPSYLFWLLLAIITLLYVLQRLYGQT